LTKEETRELQRIAQRIRLGIVKSVAAAASGHPGGSLSVADIMATLYFKEMRIDSKNPTWPDRDRFVMSKGHAAPALYATLAEAGFIGKEELTTLRKFGSRLQGHPSMRHVPGVEMSTGSLGQGLSAANGMAIAAKLDKRPTRVYVIIGDGEAQEGQIWEASMTSVHRKLDNLMVFFACNLTYCASQTSNNAMFLNSHYSTGFLGSRNHCIDMNRLNRGHVEHTG
jgi:transketolase